MYAKSAVEPHHGNELKGLDGVYQSLLRPTCKIGSMLTAAQCQELRGISFFKGFQLKLTVRFAPDRVAQMKGAWRNG